MAEQKENDTGKSAAQLDSEHFSPYRADGKLVRLASEERSEEIVLMKLV
jgi:hypothetical protein